jgi:hypothetical protein
MGPDHRWRDPGHAPLTLTANAQATAAGVDCGLPESDADALAILNNFYPGYWWDHTNLTVAVQAHPSATEEQLAAISGAIETWDTVLRDCFDDLITLTQVARRQDADIVVHYAPTVGGWCSAATPSAATMAAPTSWSARTRRRAWTATPMTPNIWAG